MTRYVPLMAYVALITALHANLASADQPETRVRIDILHHSIDGRNITLRWLPERGFVLSINDTEVKNLETSMDDQGTPTFKGIWTDHGLAVSGRVLRIADDALLVDLDVEGQPPLRVAVNSQGGTTSLVCRCSAVGPTTKTCAKGRDCDNVASCGTGTYCVWRYSQSATVIEDF